MNGQTRGAPRVSLRVCVWRSWTRAPYECAHHLKSRLEDKTECPGMSQLDPKHAYDLVHARRAGRLVIGGFVALDLLRLESELSV
jgi:hypothetical protein